MAEETCKGLVTDKLKEIKGYPDTWNKESGDVIWFKENSYKDNYEFKWISDILSKASKKQTYKNDGTPDFMVVKRNSNLIVVIECKDKIKYHSNKANINDYILEGYGDSEATEEYAIDGALWYAEFFKNNYDVIAIAVSGISEIDSKITTFIWPKNGDKIDVRLVSDGSLAATKMQSINELEKDIEIILGRNNATEEEIKKELRKYTLSCANFLRANGIEDNSKAGFVSAIILGLTNKESDLYKITTNVIESKNRTKSKIIIDEIDDKSIKSVKYLKEALYGNEKDEYDDDYVKGIFDIDNIPKGKRKSLKKFYDILLTKNELSKTPKGLNNYFKYGNTVLSACIYSLYENVILVLEKYHGIDVMGEFYTTFLRFTKGNAKEKGIVLTPKHITDLFCDLAEYYLGKRFDENTKILDTCCGTGGFLISALYRIKENIDKETISIEEKAKKFENAQKNSLIGVEKDSSMYALAYANMRFHGDGKSNLFNSSSLMSDSFLSTDGSGDAYTENGKVSLIEALKSFGDIDVGMINPPYSLNSSSENKENEYQIIKDINKVAQDRKNLEKEVKKIKKTDAIKAEALLKEIEKLNLEHEKLQQQLKEDRMDEVVIQKGQDELDFTASMLHYLKKDGIGIVILPMSCAGNSGSKLRAEILKYHTLLACVTMPQQLFFDSHVGTATCIMVFKAHVPHDENKAVFFGRWKDDGFKVIPHNGRKDAGLWNKIRQEWIDQIDGVAEPNNKIWLKKKIKITDEALAEAYIETDYSKLCDADFERTLKKFALFKYMDENGLLEV